MPAGRPPLPFNQEIADEICERLVTSRMGLEYVLDSMRADPAWEGTPGLTTAYRWMAANPTFAECSARARELSADTYVDAALQEAHSARLGVVRTTKSGKGEDGPDTEERTSDNVERSKLIVQTLLKRAGQLNPKKYGDKMDLNHSGGIQLLNSIPRPD